MNDEHEWIVTETWFDTRVVQTAHEPAGRKVDYFHAAAPRPFGTEAHAEAFINRAKYAAPWLPPEAHSVQYHIRHHVKAAKKPE
jgi:hypothetical protein